MNLIIAQLGLQGSYMYFGQLELRPDNAARDCQQIGKGWGCLALHVQALARRMLVMGEVVSV